MTNAHFAFLLKNCQEHGSIALKYAKLTHSGEYFYRPLVKPRAGKTVTAVRAGKGGVSMINHANTENVPIAPRYRGNRELMHKKSTPFYGLFVTEKYERNGL